MYKLSEFNNNFFCLTLISPTIYKMTDLHMIWQLPSCWDLKTLQTTQYTKIGRTCFKASKLPDHLPLSEITQNEGRHPSTAKLSTYNTNNIIQKKGKNNIITTVTSTPQENKIGYLSRKQNQQWWKRWITCWPFYFCEGE